MMRPFNNTNNLFEDFFSNNDSLFNNNKSFWIPPADVYEDTHYFKFRLDLPGVKKINISIKISNGKLIVSGKRELPFENPVFKYHSIERNFGNFYREFSLPENISDGEIKAELESGELILSLPKKSIDYQNIKIIEVK